MLTLLDWALAASSWPPVLRGTPALLFTARAHAQTHSEADKVVAGRPLRRFPVIRWSRSPPWCPGSNTGSPQLPPVPSVLHELSRSLFYNPTFAQSHLRLMHRSEGFSLSTGHKVLHGSSAVLPTLRSTGSLSRHVLLAASPWFFIINYNVKAQFFIQK